ncbi:MAG: hypothetical protein Q8916_08000 [Bacteroidota bacterium]|nr:hypothetical protein [Bacteroidota bacterium]MDP4230327.1 hypothetical protein [Bacteroidota bacterium]MDP4236361.1 hypothetical protein [Bacteroidota bacterium]
MKQYLLSLFIIGAFLFGAGSLSAQTGDVLNPSEGTGFLIGPVGGINLVSYKTNSFPILSSEPTCFTAQNGSDIAPFFGLTAEFPLSASMQSFIIVEGLYDSKSSKFTATNSTRTGIPTKVNGNVAPGDITTSETATLTYFTINPGYKYNFTEGPSPVGPGVQLCISVGFKLASSLNKTVTVSAADPNGTNGALLSSTQSHSDPVTGVQGIRIGIRGQFDYDIPLSPAWIATPMVGYDLPFTKVDNTDKSWSASSAYGGIALRYFIGK